MPLTWNIDVRTIQILYCAAAQQFEGAIKVVSKNFQRTNDPRLASSSQAIGVGAAAEHRFPPQTYRLHNIGSSANAAVEKDFDSSVNRGDYLWQNTNGRRN